MILREGGVRIESTILFGKYQLGQVIGRGRDGIVYLAEHKELEEYRAIKRVSKTCVEYEQFRREALLLKELHHPGIPIIYDLEEDLEYSYLIEEYLEGDSL
ncbi:MAG: protein kinase, partial [Hungatella sp.]